VGIAGGEELIKKFLCLAGLFLTLAILAAPVMAVPATKGTYTQVILSQVVFDGDNFMTGDIVHMRNKVGEGYAYAVSFPLGNSLFTSDTGGGQLNLASLTGNYIANTVDTYAAGTLEGTINIKFTSGGVYLYTGPTFTFTTNGVTGTLTTGDIFGGLLYEIMIAKHGIGDLAGFTLKGESSGISIQAVIKGDPTLMGMNVDIETGTYSWNHSPSFLFCMQYF
jgi:hypothetical protein